MGTKADLQRALDLGTADFRAWLAEHEAVLGQTEIDLSNQCVMARYLTDRTAEPVTCGPTGTRFTADLDLDTWCKLPPWAVAVAAHHDSRYMSRVRGESLPKDVYLKNEFIGLLS